MYEKSHEERERNIQMNGRIETKTEIWRRCNSDEQTIYIHTYENEIYTFTYARFECGYFSLSHWECGIFCLASFFAVYIN